MDLLESLLKENERLISYCANKLCVKYNCNHLKEDLVSVGNLVILQKSKDFKEDFRAIFSTYVYPFLLGTMKREIERYLYPMNIPKDEFQNNLGLLKTNFTDLESIIEYELSSINVEKEVLNRIYIECVLEEFDKLTFKEKQLIGGFYGAFGYEKQIISDLAEEFQMKESALQKAKDNAVEKLSYNCFRGKFVIYRLALAKIRKAKKQI